MWHVVVRKTVNYTDGNTAHSLWSWIYLRKEILYKKSKTILKITQHITEILLITGTSV